MKKINILVLFLVVISVLLTSFSYYAYQVMYSPNILVKKENRFLFIPTGAGFTDVQHLLYEEGFVNDPLSFSFLARLMKYDQNIKPGKYELKSNMTNREAIRLLRSGEQTPVRITFNNIRFLEDLPPVVCEGLEMKPGELEALLFDPNYFEKLGFTRDNFLVMFIPNTYEVYWDITPEQFLERMNREYERFWSLPRVNQADSLKMSRQEVSVLASIVKAECSKNEEATIIAGLYLNRLKKNMPLQADPSVVYANRDFTIRRVLTKHKEIDSPYNTYRYPGLPPGPINMPDIRYIDAVLKAEEHNYIYMCAREDFSGYHYFTASYQEHLNNARKYTQTLNAEKIYK